MRQKVAIKKKKKNGERLSWSIVILCVCVCLCLCVYNKYNIYYCICILYHIAAAFLQNPRARVTSVAGLLQGFFFFLSPKRYNIVTSYILLLYICFRFVRFRFSIVFTGGAQCVYYTYIYIYQRWCAVASVAREMRRVCRPKLRTMGA